MKKVILVSGASSGIGKITAEFLAKQGHTVYGAARRTEKMEDSKRYNVIPISMDITEQEDIEYVVNRIIDEQGKIDVLVNNAGFGLFGAVEDISMEEARYQFDVNIFGLAELTRKVIPYMRQQKSGKIINMSSMGGKVYTPLGSWYHATKHALEGFSDCLRLELKPFGIDVVVIEPGAILTEFGSIVVDPLKKRASKNYRGITEAVVKVATQNYEKGQGSDPVIIAKAVGHAIKKKNPKTRYLLGKYAKPMVFLRKWFGDQLFDRAIMSYIKV